MWKNSASIQVHPGTAETLPVIGRIALSVAVALFMAAALSACGGGESGSSGGSSSPPGTLVTPQPQNTPLPTAVGTDDYRVRMVWGNYDARLREISAPLIDWNGSMTLSDTGGVINGLQTILFDPTTGDVCPECKSPSPTYYLDWTSTTRAFQDGIHVQVQVAAPTNPATLLTYESTGFPAGVDFNVSLFDALNMFIPMAGDASKGLLLTAIYTSGHPNQGFVQGYFFPSGATCSDGDPKLTMAGLLFDPNGFGTHYVSGNNICLNAGQPVAFAGKVTDLDNNFVGNFSGLLTFDPGLASGKLDGTWADHDGTDIGDLHAIYPMLIAPAGGYFMGYTDTP